MAAMISETSRRGLNLLGHGGDLGLARRLFPEAPEPFIDLSTGINPRSYPMPPIPPEALTRLPEAGTVQRLAELAADAYGAPGASCVVPAPGSQILLPLVAALVSPGHAGILAPGYAGHARSAALANHAVVETTTLDELASVNLALLSNPNNPDGRLVMRQSLLALGAELARRGGLLVVDEAFMDVGPPGASLAGDVEQANIVVLRSFGKFFGLAGLRLGFALTRPDLAADLRTRLGPWAVSGPALTAASVALAHGLSASAVIPAASAGPDTAQGPSRVRRSAARSGLVSANPSRRPASPKNFPNERRTTILAFSTSPAKLAPGGPTSINASSTTRSPPRRPSSAASASRDCLMRRRPSGLLGLDSRARLTLASSSSVAVSITA